MSNALRHRGVNPGDAVAILCPNSHEMLESHYSVPMAGAVINTINIRLDAATLSSTLEHGEKSCSCPVRPSSLWVEPHPPSSVIQKSEEIGFHITHFYGLAETFGSSALCVPQPQWQALWLEQRALKMPRQGVSTHGLDEIAVLDVVSGEAVPADSQTMGAIWRLCTLTTTSRFGTGPRMSSYPAERTSLALRLRACFTAAYSGPFRSLILV